MPAHFEGPLWSGQAAADGCVGLCMCCSGLLQPGKGQSCKSAPPSLRSAWECCEEAGNVSIAPQGQSPPSHTMEGWAGPEKAEGWVTAWSSPLELPQPSPHRHCCCCRHPVSISCPRTSLPAYSRISYCPTLGSIPREGEDQPEELERLCWGGLDSR